MSASFRVKQYDLVSDKIKEKPICLALISDLHGKMYGPRHRELIKALEKAEVDLILIAGDLINRRDVDSLKNAELFFETLPDKNTVYYVPGNHETYHVVNQSPDYLAYEQRLMEMGIHILHNAKQTVCVREQELGITGLELPLSYYKKPFYPKLTKEEMKAFVGECSATRFEILLAHNPAFGRTYFEWGADLTLSGHYHGGVLRFSENLGTISPQFHLFPKFCCGLFRNKQQAMAVSAGLGEHSMTLRLNNPRELLIIKIRNHSL